MRDRYGTRAIDARSKQSALDTTPSGRQAYLEQQGLTPKEAERERRIEFNKELKRAPLAGAEPAPPAQMPLFTRQSRRQPFEGGLASPEDIGLLRSQGASGTMRTPFRTVTLGLLPETGPAEEMTSFLPTASPLTGFGLPSRSSFLGSPIPKRFNRYG